MRTAVLSRRELLVSGTALGGLGVAGRGLAAPAPVTPTSGTIRVPLDHFDPKSPNIAIGYEWGAPYRAHLPTVLLVADAQQFYLRPGAASDLQSKLFGDGLNVLGFFGRAASPELRKHVNAGTAIDWERACRVLNVHQWIGDLNAAADSLRIPPDRLAVYGRSGGADLVLRFLAMHPRRAARAYVQAAVTHDLAARWGVSADHFWEELTARDAGAAQRLAALVEAKPELRREGILLLQRQNFYEPLDALQDARVALVNAIVSQDRTKLASYRERYQLDSLAAMRAKGQDLGQVRVHEFSRPYRDPRGKPPPLRPDIEAIFYYSEPVTRQMYDAQVRLPYPAIDNLRSAITELLIVAGRFDHTSDYRTQIGLAGIMPRSELLLLDDDHVFKRLTASGRHPALLQAFLTDGLRSDAYRRAKDALATLRWNETP